MACPLIMLTDSYKYSHWRVYPEKTQKVYSYLASRGGKFDRTLWFGLQYYLQEYLAGEVLDASSIDLAEAFAAQHFGSSAIFNGAGFRRLLAKHKGRLPVSIKALPEGSVVPTKTPLLTVENTDTEFPWLTNFLETLLCQPWYPTTVATLSLHLRWEIEHFLERTGSVEGLPYKLHDFGFRGVSSVESAALGGAAHLVNFLGTDTIAGIILAQRHYGEAMAGFSIPATEHSTITAWGRAHEGDAYAHLLAEFPTGVVACVSDSYNIYEACSELWGGSLRQTVMNRNGTLVVRPDSGYAPEVVVRCLKILGEKFGSTHNAKGFKVLDPHVRLIQGDGVDLESVNDILRAMAKAGWSADNIAFGMGGGLLQKLNRDTQKFAFKCSAIEIGDEWRDVYKNPVTDRAKASMRGRFAVHAEGAHAVTVPYGTAGEDLLVEVFRDGEILRTWSFAEVRARARSAVRP